jgi:hypothetical protein
MMWYWISICFVGQWNLGLEPSWMAFWLFKRNIVGVDCEYPRFAKRWHNQTTSFVAMISSTYSILVVDLTVHCCLWLTQAIGPPLRKTM